MSLVEILPEYVENLRGLLAQDGDRWHLVVERQILGTVIPHLRGPSESLINPLWHLLLICLGGPRAEIPPMTSEAWNHAREAAKVGRASTDDGPALFPRAAARLAEVLTEMRRNDFYPPRKIQSE